MKSWYYSREKDVYKHSPQTAVEVCFTVKHYSFWRQLLGNNNGRKWCLSICFSSIMEALRASLKTRRDSCLNSNTGLPEQGFSPGASMSSNCPMKSTLEWLATLNCVQVFGIPGRDGRMNRFNLKWSNEVILIPVVNIFVSVIESLEC